MDSQGKFELSNISTVRDNKEVNDDIVDFPGSELFNNFLCGRFPHMKYCLCNPPCSDSVPQAVFTEVFDKIFIGPIEAAYKLRELKAKGVTHVLNISCTYYTKRPRVHYLDIDIHDSLSENIKKHFRITNRYIDEARRDGAILVHCTDGKSRSPAFVLAYLIAKQKIKLKDGLGMLKSKLHGVQPNANFTNQLIDYDLEQLAKSQ